MTVPSLVQNPGSQRRRAVVVHEDPTEGCRLADHLAAHGYEAILTRQIEDVQRDLPHIRPDVIVIGLASPATPQMLPRVQSVCPLVPIIAMTQSDVLGHGSEGAEHETVVGAGVFLCRSSSRDRQPARPL